MEKVNASECAYRGGKSGVKYFFRGPHFDWGTIRLLPGEKLGGHYHKRVEEQFYFLRGTPLLLVNGEERRVREQDVFRLPPGDQHDIVNDTAEAADILFVKCPYDLEDKVAI